MSGIPLVVKGLSVDDTDTQRNAAMLLINLSVNAKNKASICEAGAVDSLLRLLTGKIEDDIRQYCVRTLCNLATDADNREEIRRLHGIASLVNCAQSADSQLVKYAARCIGLLAVSETCLEELIRHDCHSILAERVSNSGDDVIREAVMALTRMCRSEVIKTQINKRGIVTAMVSEVENRVGTVDNIVAAPKESEDMLAIALKLLAAASDHPDVQASMVEQGVPLLLEPLIDGKHLHHTRPALACISNLSKGEQVQREMRRRDCIPKFVKGLQHSDPNVCAEMLRVLYHLAATAENRNSITKLGGILYIVNLLTSNSPNVQHEAVKALQQMTVDAENEVVIANAGGLRPLVGLLRSENIDTQRRALCCLGNLTVTSENQLLVASTQGVPKLVQCLQSSDARVKRDASRTIRNIAFASSNREVLLQEGAIPHLLACVDGDDVETLRYAMRALSIISAHIGCQEVIVACKGLQSVLKTLQGTDNDARRSAAGTLINLSGDADQHQTELRSLNGLKVIIRCLAQAAQDMDLVRSLLRCLSNLCQNGENAIETCHLGGVQPVLRCVSLSDVEIKRTACSVMAVLAQTVLGLEQVLLLHPLDNSSLECLADSHSQCYVHNYGMCM